MWKTSSTHFLVFSFFCILNTSVSTQKCVNNEGIVICSNLPSLSDLSKEITPTWKDITIINKVGDTFLIGDSASDQNLNVIEKLDLSRAGKIVATHRHPLKDLSSLRNLNVSGGQISALRVSYFNPITALDYLLNEKNQMNALNMFTKNLSLEFNFLKSASKLEYLSIDDNLLDVIPSNSFKEVPQIKILSIAANPLKKIEDRAFQGLDNLKVLNLSYNSLVSLTPNVFIGFNRVKLIHLDLSQNKIESLSDQPFQYLTLLQNLNISGNSINSLDLSSFDGLRTLRKLIISNNNISEVGENTFSSLISLDTLDLSGNSIVTLNLNVFPVAMPRLKKLNLGHNLIKDMPVEVLESFNGLAELLIDHNKLTFLPDTNGTFSALKKIAIIGNPWQCPCLDSLVLFLEAK